MAKVGDVVFDVPRSETFCGPHANCYGFFVEFMKKEFVYPPFRTGYVISSKEKNGSLRFYPIFLLGRRKILPISAGIRYHVKSDGITITKELFKLYANHAQDVIRAWAGTSYTILLRDTHGCFHTLPSRKLPKQSLHGTALKFGTYPGVLR